MKLSIWTIVLHKQIAHNFCSFKMHDGKPNSSHKNWLKLEKQDLSDSCVSYFRLETSNDQLSQYHPHLVSSQLIAVRWEGPKYISSSRNVLLLQIQQWQVNLSIDIHTSLLCTSYCKPFWLSCTFQMFGGKSCLNCTREHQSLHDRNEITYAAKMMLILQLCCLARANPNDA